MTANYATFDSTQPAPQRVTGWFEADAVTYLAPAPEANRFPLTAEQWAARTTGEWAVSGAALVPYTRPPPVVTLAQQAVELQAAGLTITGASQPALNGVYDCGSDTQSHIQAEMIAILVNSSFADGTATVAWPDTTGTLHTFTSLAEFKAFALAIGAFVAACAKVQNGTSTTLPTATATIA